MLYVFQSLLKRSVTAVLTRFLAFLLCFAGTLSAWCVFVVSGAFKTGFMADISLFGHIDSIRYVESGILVRVSEVRAGYTRSDGTCVKGEVLYFSVLFKPFLRKYIENYFGVGSLVKVKGTVLPYYRTRDGEIREGLTIFGQTLDVGSYPSRSAIKDRSALKSCSSGVGDVSTMGSPDVEGFMSDDFG